MARDVLLGRLVGGVGMSARNALVFGLLLWCDRFAYSSSNSKRYSSYFPDETLKSYQPRVVDSSNDE